MRIYPRLLDVHETLRVQVVLLAVRLVGLRFPLVVRREERHVRLVHLTRLGLIEAVAVLGLILALHLRLSTCYVVGLCLAGLTGLLILRNFNR